MTKFLTITVVTLRAMLLLAPTISPAKMNPA